ncbi:MAG: hypothetical protein Q8L41_06110 [Anaerolineales bacterium]|nr:hypothetical protein [Anaerolineales bacterium]
MAQLFTASYVSRLRKYKHHVLLMIIHERVPFFGFAIVALLLPFIGLQAGLIITFILLTWQGLGGGFTANSWKSCDPDTSRLWWSEVSVTQNLTHAVRQDPGNSVHCWLQKATHVRKANADEKAGDVFIDTNKSMEKYREWLKLALPRRPVQPPMALEDHIGTRVLSNQQKRRINYLNDFRPERGRTLLLVVRRSRRTKNRK